ncbi:protein-L-isoaspartate(D-aspartate) O-methyltransferase [Congregibacter litoralis]|uniref:Protein-L-isoaspartate O-methyltransferase n=1 Tax=Congregibacter litoralis KT71 TaxID=314285 RepID=A4AAC2_9GAMM|nr:protein-L-isoaspartate(D-aspartate) O-methyltransferase [Congregibacter litoralis]EAQ96999.1 protein-L-isoaspartate(D-aspartate) O-methyltransferase [Congregibacter litoralis KT71]
MNRSADVSGIGMTSQRTRERLVQRLQEQGVSNIAVLDAMRNVPRHLFLDEAMAHRAYEDTALPIGYQQTLSQPYIVARMTELLITGRDLGKVLEIGSGSGYQSAVLAGIVGEVFALERIKPLLMAARKRMRQLKLRNVQMRHGDGYEGWESQAPFDGILAAAAPEQVPQSLLAQLAVGGRLVMPVGGREQTLVVVERTDSGFERYDIEPVRFVPLLPGLGNG